MTDLFQFFPQLGRWHQQGRGLAIATVTDTWGSAPRRPGAMMAITDQSEMLGSVSAGCVEGAVIESAQQVIASGQAMHLHYGVSDALALDVGLACGGEIAIYVQPYPHHLHQQIAPYMERQQTFYWCTQQQGDEIVQTIRTDCDQQGVVRVSQSSVCQKIAPPFTLVIVGANHIAIALSRLAQVLGYRIIVIDPRTAFANRDRFPDVDHLLTRYPHHELAHLPLNATTAIAVLAHDPKIDDPALMQALQSDAFYVGALGGRTTQQKRRARLLEQGLSAEQIERLHAPIGLDIGAETPEQIALAILSEIVACQMKA